MGKVDDPKCACCGVGGYPHVSDSGKAYRYIRDSVREYESGAMYDESKNRLVKPMINAENAVRLQSKGIEKREENRIKAALAGAGVAINGQMDLTPYKGMSNEDIVTACVVERMTEQALAGDGHASVKAQENTLRMIDRWPDRNKPQTSSQVNEIIIRGPAADAILGQNEVIDAEFRDSTEQVQGETDR